ncbi:MAG: GntR family transcriptional regulator [Lachnospiraceae bacterium]
MSTLKEQAYETLKKQIMEAESETVFTVRKSAEELGFSFTPVREALVKLKNEGILDLNPNSGFTVAELDMRAIQNIYQSRECVEHYVLPLVVERLDEDDIRILNSLVLKQQKAMDEGDTSLYTEMDVEFHVYLIDKLQNQQLSEFYRRIRSQYSLGAKNIEKDHSDIPIKEHLRFIELIKNKQYDEALKCLYDHTSAAVERMKDGYVRIGL